MARPAAIFVPMPRNPKNPARRSFTLPTIWLTLALPIALLSLREAGFRPTLSPRKPGISTSRCEVTPAPSKPRLSGAHRSMDRTQGDTLGQIRTFDPHEIFPQLLSRLDLPASAATRIAKRLAALGMYRNSSQRINARGLPSAASKRTARYAYSPTSSRQDIYFTPSDSLFPFNPNTVTEKALERLGFSRKAAGMIAKFRAKGGYFRKKKDFERLYCVSPSTYTMLEPYIRIASPSAQAHDSYFTPGGSRFPFNPNTVTTQNLQRLGFSRKATEMIAKFRAKGGYFQKKEDFERLYCVNSSTYRALAPYIRITAPEAPRRNGHFAPSDSLFPFNPNTVTTKALQQLGFSRKAAEMIAKFRARGGFFRKKEDFKRLYCVDPATYATLEPYIELPPPQRYERACYFTPGDTLFPFNPNTATTKALQRLGFSRKAAEMIEKFRTNGGTFRIKEDFGRLYCVDSSTYRILKDYLKLD